jgi:hypothetical protein
MKRLLLFSALLLTPQGKVKDVHLDPVPKPPMVAPTVTHHDVSSVQHYDRVEISCPDGYEGHFVDVDNGFEWNWNHGIQMGMPLGYTVCFSKEFMDQIRANPDLLRQRPAPPNPA